MQKRTRSLKLGTLVVNALWSCIDEAGQDIFFELDPGLCYPLQ